MGVGATLSWLKKGAWRWRERGFEAISSAMQNEFDAAAADTGSDDRAEGPAPFFKMHGLGNDFVILDARRGKPFAARPVTPALARALGNRRRGVGFDQLIVIRDGAGGAEALIEFFNPDGGMSAACGNGTRCVADLLMREARRNEIVLESTHALLPCERLQNGLVQVDMGPPELDWRKIPLAEASDTVRVDVKLGPIDNPALWGPAAVNMGNPHCIFFVEDAEAEAVDRLGPMIEHHPMFPERTNVEFATVLKPNRVRLRVWERGAGITEACGSGACATVVAGVRRGLLARRTTVALDGGALEIEWRESDGHVLMTGPTSTVFAGALHPSFLQAAQAEAQAEAGLDTATSAGSAAPREASLGG